MSTGTSPAVKPATVKGPTAEQVLVDWIVCNNHKYSFHRLVDDLRNKYGVNGWEASYFLARRLKEIITIDLFSVPSDAMTETAFATMLRVARWGIVSNRIGQYYTPQVIRQIDADAAAEVEQDEAAAAGRADEAAEELGRIETFA